MIMSFLCDYQEHGYYKSTVVTITSFSWMHICYTGSAATIRCISGDACTIIWIKELFVQFKSMEQRLEHFRPCCIYTPELHLKLCSLLCIILE
ncbi:uncharacterized protein LOC100383736 [Zea mays]|uniref:Uncharacterized protein n=1 Tax=Zea mays TaxID=4577 RepID=C0PIP1_MAIZE|nr:uncharacterized protein LOC100383736 [Zea mays]ACN35057.1 unknown [Zea mays]|eukprot:NP_001169844.1 uncharacterized protein LOC100383736 [Zea mays]